VVDQCSTSVARRASSCRQFGAGHAYGDLTAGVRPAKTRLLQVVVMKTGAREWRRSVRLSQRGCVGCPGSLSLTPVSHLQCAESRSSVVGRSPRARRQRHPHPQQGGVRAPWPPKPP
jgi:hypothetical protein